MKDFGTRVKALLKEKKMRPQDLVNKTGISKSQMSLYLSNKTKPRRENAELIAKELDVSADFLLTGVGATWDPFDKFAFLSNEDIWDGLSEREKDFLTGLSATEKDIIKELRNGSKRNKDLILFALGKAVIIPDDEYKKLLEAKQMYEKYREEIDIFENQSRPLTPGQVTLYDLFSEDE